MMKLSDFEENGKAETKLNRRHSLSLITHSRVFLAFLFKPQIQSLYIRLE